MIHGRRSTYVRRKCRCAECRAAANAYQKARRRALVDAGTHRVLKGRLIPIDRKASAS